MADWSKLPMDLLTLIALKLVFMDEFVVFGAVCKSWFDSLSTLRRRHSLPTKFPWLMLAENENHIDDSPDYGNDHPEPRSFFNPSTKHTCQVDIPEASRRKCFGVNYGWLLTIGYDLGISLLQPFSRYQIALPSMLSFVGQLDYIGQLLPRDVIDIYIKKAVISCDPYLNDSFRVMVIYGERGILAFARHGVDEWTDLPTSVDTFEDVICYKGNFVAVNYAGNLVVCGLKYNEGPRTRTIRPVVDLVGDKDDKYLVESSGFLYLIIRTYKGDDSPSVDAGIILMTEVDEEEYEKGKGRYETIKFSVLMTERVSGQDRWSFKWVDIQSMGAKTIFLGNNSSRMLSAAEHEGWFKPNCIYFCENRTVNYEIAPGGGGRDMGVFDLETRTIEPCYEGKSLSRLSPPLWVI